MKYIEMSNGETPNLMRIDGINISFDSWRWDNNNSVYILFLDGKSIGYVGKKMTEWFASYVEDL